MAEITWRTWTDGYITGENPVCRDEYIVISEQMDGRWRWTARRARIVYQQASGWAATADEAKRDAEAWMTAHRVQSEDELTLVNETPAEAPVPESWEWTEAPDGDGYVINNLTWPFDEARVRVDDGGRVTWHTSTLQRIRQVGTGQAQYVEDAKADVEAWLNAHRRDQTTRQVLQALRRERARLNHISMLLNECSDLDGHYADFPNARYRCAREALNELIRELRYTIRGLERQAFDQGLDDEGW